MAVASGKGGVGKSSVSVNLAVALARQSLRVAILDCDIYGFSVPALIGLERPPSFNGRNQIVPGYARGVDVMSMEFFVRDNSPVVWRDLIVTTPDPFAARVAERAGAMALKMGHAVLGIVENMAFRVCPECGHREYPLGKGGGDAVAAALKTQVLARIPFAPAPPGPRRDGLFDPGTPAGQAYEELAAKVRAALFDVTADEYAAAVTPGSSPARDT